MEPRVYTVVLEDGDAAWNPATTKWLIHGPVRVIYRQHADGAIDAAVEAPDAMARAAAERYPLGIRVEFRDEGVVALDTKGPVLARGVINGEPALDSAARVYIPVFAERDRGREPTTVFVAAANIVRAIPEEEEQ